MNRLIRVTLVLALGGLLAAEPAGAQVVGVDAPGAVVQVWQVNIKQLERNWQGFIERMAVSDFKPDIIIVQELSNAAGNSDFTRFLNAVNERFAPTSYAGAHGDPSGIGTGESTFAVFWKTSRFSQTGVDRWTVMAGGSCSTPEKKLAVNLFDNLQGGNLVAASVHFPPGMSTSCLDQNLATVHSKVGALQSVRRMTLIAGDLNQRPDKHGELPSNGLEADPDCWYRRFSAPHDSNSLASGNCVNTLHKKYTDVVWAFPGGGGFNNPTPTSFCEQFTYSNDVGVPIDANDVSNACTDVVGGGLAGNAGPNGVLDQGRIDYIWAGWMTPDGLTLKPSAPQAAALIEYASADLGLSFRDLQTATSYSDHRAVQATVRYAVGTI